MIVGDFTSLQLLGLDEWAQVSQNTQEGSWDSIFGGIRDKKSSPALKSGAV
jgi:hypothetical protein